MVYVYPCFEGVWKWPFKISHKPSMILCLLDLSPCAHEKRQTGYKTDVLTCVTLVFFGGKPMQEFIRSASGMKFVSPA